MSTPETELLHRVLAVVRESGDLVREHWKRPRNVRLKGRIDLVTDTDMAVEAFLKARLEQVLPGSTFVAEESASSLTPGEDCWIIDPIDGTTNFAHGVPFVATSIGLWRNGGVALGVVDIPVMGETFWATRGGGAWCNGEPVHVSRRMPLAESLVATGFPYTISEKVDEVVDRLRRVLVEARGVRRCGAAAVDLAYVAAGRYEAFYEDDLKPWDTAAGWLLVEEAGGAVTSFDGTAYGFGRALLATNGLVHQDLVSLLVTEGKR
jgi:myo-inositol-1(or 4)-monophosphatase